MAKFFIDAGHGGTESGAIGNGMIEKNINLIVAQEVERILKLNGQEVKMSRSSDITLDLNTRCAMANQSGADYFVSIHHNANDGITTGSEVYCSIVGGKGKILAQNISNQFIGRNSRVLSKESDTTKGQDYYAVIRQTNMPAVITEFGYIDSQDYINFDTLEELLSEAKMIAVGCLKTVGVENLILIFSSVQSQEHWAQKHFDYLKSRGILISETRFDDKITRAETMALLAQLVK